MLITLLLKVFNHVILFDFSNRMGTFISIYCFIPKIPALQTYKLKQINKSL